MPGRNIEIGSTTPVGLPPHNNVRGAFLLIAAMALFTFETLIIRWLGNQTNVSQAVLFRSCAQLLVVAAWAAWRGTWPKLSSQRLGMHFARGLTSICSWWAYYLTFHKLDFGLATLLTFTSSLFVVVLAGPVLGEKVKAASWIATLIGFGGIALATGGASGLLDSAVLIGLVSAALSAALVFQTRSLTRTEDTLTIMTYIGLFVIVAAVPMAMLDWLPMSVGTAGLLFLAGIAGAFGMVLMIEAYAVGQAAVLAPIPYIRIAFAMVFGMLLFNETPSISMLLGTLVVISAALYAIRAERRV